MRKRASCNVATIQVLEVLSAPKNKHV